MGMEFSQAFKMAYNFRKDYFALDEIVSLKKLKEVCNKINIILIPYSLIKKELNVEIFSMDAFNIHKNNSCVIYYNNRCCQARIIFSICHELGHYFLNTQDERKANCFARNFINPYIYRFVEMYDYRYISKKFFEVAQKFKEIDEFYCTVLKLSYIS